MRNSRLSSWLASRYSSVYIEARTTRFIFPWDTRTEYRMQSSANLCFKGGSSRKSESKTIAPDAGLATLYTTLYAADFLNPTLRGCLPPSPLPPHHYLPRHLPDDASPLACWRTHVSRTVEGFCLAEAHIVAPSHHPAAGAFSPQFERSIC